MSLDGSVCACLVYELNNKLVNGKIDKIYQPSKDEILINIRASRIKYKLLLSASGNYPRVHLTENIIDNPSNPPAFCMLLRKHLEGSILNQITQYKMDRIIKFDFSSKDELGLLEDKSLILEIMGKYSNIILVNKDSKILDSLKSQRAELLKEIEKEGIKPEDLSMEIEKLEKEIVDLFQKADSMMPKV